MNLGMFVMITVLGDGSIGLLMENNQVVTFDYDEARRRLNELKPHFPIRHGFAIGWEVKEKLQSVGEGMVDCCYVISRHEALALGAISQSEALALVNVPSTMLN